MQKDYTGLKLTPSIFSDLLIELFDGKQFERKEALQKIPPYFQEQGGILENKNYIQVFKAATKRLKDKGIYNKGYGVWVLNYNETTTEISTTPNNNTIKYSIDKEIGAGQQSIYVYYYDAYKKLAELEGNSYWECKIGRTEENPINRVLTQAGTSYPETPHIALVIHCSDSNKLESAIHSILKYKNRWIEKAPGSEWFLTTPEEIEELYIMFSSN